MQESIEQIYHHSKDICLFSSENGFSFVEKDVVGFSLEEIDLQLLLCNNR